MKVKGSHEDKEVHRWKVIAAKAPGVSHLQRGEECQDAYGYRSLRDGLVAVVADGAGSATMGGPGAQAACDEVLAAVQHAWLDFGDSEVELRRLLVTAMMQARERLEKMATDYSREKELDSRKALSAFSTTLMILIKGRRWTGALHVGDGWIVADNGRGFELLTLPERGEYANETVFLTTSTPLGEVAKVAVVRSARLRGVAIITDGLEAISIKLSKQIPAEPFWNGVFSFCRGSSNRAMLENQLADFLRSDRVNNEVFDDKTLLVACQSLPRRATVTRSVRGLKRRALKWLGGRLARARGSSG